MKLFTSKKKLQKEIKNNKNVSFVPTMGAFHKGHESLIKKSVKNSKKTIVSIFVNPKQFDNKKDFKKYPNNFNKDLKILKKLKVNYLYKPNYQDIYNFKSRNKIFLHNFSRQLCGKFRKGHFKGVIDVVNRFLEIIKPKKIYLGNKDFQQLILIREHIKKNKIKSKIVSCKTIRNQNFVAYSSRLIMLKNYEKIILINALKILKKFKKDLVTNKIKYNFHKVKIKLLSAGVKKIDYVKIIDLKTLKKPKKNINKFNLFFALYIGKVRIIDNF